MRTFEINLGELHLTRLAYQKQIEKLTQHKEKLSSLADKLSTMWEGKVATQFIQNMQIFLAVEYNNLLDDYREIAKKLEEAEELFVPLLSLCEGFPDIIKHGNSIGYTISGAAPSPDDILSLDEASGLEINEGIQEYSRQLTKINTLWNQAYSSSSGLSRSSFRLSNYEATFAEGTQRQGKAVSDFFDAFSFNYVPALKEADEKVANSLTNLFETVYYTSMASQSNNLAEARGLFPAELQEILTIKQQQMYALNLTNMLKYLTEEEIEQIKAGGHPQIIFEKKDPEIQNIYNEFQNQTMEMLSKEQRADLSFLSSILIQILPIGQKKAILDKLKTQDGKISLEDLDEIQKLHPSYVVAVGPSIDSLLETEYKMNQNHFSFREAEQAKWNEHRAQLNALMMWSSIRLVNNIQTAGTQAILYGDNRFDNLERTGSTLSLKSPAELKQLEAQRIGDRVRSNVAESRRVREATNDGFNRWNEQAKQIEQQGKELENYRASNPELWKLTTKDLNYVKANNGLSNIVNSINTGEINIGNLSPNLQASINSNYFQDFTTDMARTQLEKILNNNGTINTEVLKQLVPEGTPNTFKPDADIADGEKYVFRLADGRRVAIRWHAPDAYAAQQYPDSTSGNEWTAQIEVGKWRLKTDGTWTKDPVQNSTHIPLEDSPTE